MFGWEGEREKKGGVQVFSFRAHQKVGEAGESAHGLRLIHDLFFFFSFFFFLSASSNFSVFFFFFGAYFFWLVLFIKIINKKLKCPYTIFFNKKMCDFFVLFNGNIIVNLY